MKYVINYKWTAALLLLLSGAQYSCTKEAFTKANVNPNSPGSVVPANILPIVETSLAYTQGGDLTRYTSLFTQQDLGSLRQAAAYYSYVMTSGDFDTPWSNMYTSVMGNDRDLMQRSDAAGYNRYSGLSRILMAYSLQLLVDSWGDVPYSEALGGAANTHPQFDKSKALYDTIASLVNVGISQLSNASAGGVVPGSDDLIYGGNAGKWIKFGHAIMARLFIHQSRNNPAMAASALAEANQSFTSNADNAQFVFGTSETFSSPIYQFNEQRGDIDYADGALVTRLKAMSDPRLNLLVDVNYNDVNGVGIASYFGDINGHVEFITFDEMLFVKAEAVLRTSGDIGAAQEYYREAITANMQKLGVSAADIATYLAANGTLPADAGQAIAQVALQEWIALYQNPEAWTLWRRTGAPALTAIGSLGIPRRLLYPTSEYSLNGTNTPQATLYTPRIFWDQ